MRCQSWGYAPKVIADYLPVVRAFGADDNMSAWAESFVGSHSGRCLWDAEFLTGHYSFANCLNVGGAPFLFEYLLKRINPAIEVVSADLGVDRFPMAEQVLGIRVIQLNIENAGSDVGALKGKFECIALCEVFEHLRIDLVQTMSLLRDLLTDGGLLYLTTPNGVGLTALRKHLLRGRTGPDPSTEWARLRNIGHMGHVREYSFAEVRDFIAKCGFTLEKFLYRRMLQGSRRPDYLIGALTRLAPVLGDELVFIARKQ